MNNKNYRFAGGFVLLAVAVFVTAVVLHGRGREVGAPDDRIVANASSGYAIMVPSNWYVEMSSGGTSTAAASVSPELTVYPDYDPADASTTPATCKIEITSFAVARGTNLDAWLTKYLHEDPTASVAEISRTPIAVGEASGVSAQGLEWHGILNNVTTTLVYVQALHAAAPEIIFEIAPSTLSEAGDADNDDCDFDLQALVANFTITNDEP